MFELLETLPPVPAEINVHAYNDAGKMTATVCTVMLAQYDDGEFDALLERVQAGDVKDREIAEQVLVDWVDVTRAGVQLECNPENKALFLRRPSVSAAVVRTFFDMRRALMTALEKNSQSSENTSPGGVGV